MLLGRNRASISIKRDLEHLIIDHFMNRSRIGYLLLLDFLLVLVGGSIDAHHVLIKILFLLGSSPIFVENYDHFACIIGINRAFTTRVARSHDFDNFAHERLLLIPSGAHSLEDCSGCG